MPVIRVCAHCGTKNRGASHLADTGRCGACKEPLPAVDKPMAADTALFDEVVKSAKVPVLVDFWAAWCGPCRMVGPEVERAAAEMAGMAVVLKVDTEAQPGLAGRYQIRSIPMLMVFAKAKMAWADGGVVAGGVAGGGFVDLGARGEPTLATVKLSRRWGTRAGRWVRWAWGRVG